MTTATNTNGVTSTTTAGPQAEPAKTYLYQTLRVLENGTRPKHLAAQMRLAISQYVKHVEQTHRDTIERAEAAEHHSAGLSRYKAELVGNLEAYSDAYEFQKVRTHNALVDRRAFEDRVYELTHQLAQAKAALGDQPATQDVIDRLRKNLARHEGLLKIANGTISDQADTILEMTDKKHAADRHLQEVCVDVRNAENCSDRLSVELDGVRAQLKEAHNQVEREQQAVQQLLEKNRILHQATTAAGSHLREHDHAVAVLFETVGQAQAQLIEYLTDAAGERETLGRLLGILDNGLISDAMSQLTPPAEAEGA